mgnify:CR=1 FL=1
MLCLFAQYMLPSKVYTIKQVLTKCVIFTKHIKQCQHSCANIAWLLSCSFVGCNCECDVPFEITFLDTVSSTY